MKSDTVITPNVAVDFLFGGGKMGERIRSFDWSEHPLGPPETWPQSLKITIRIMLTSRYAMWMGWGPEFYFFCNDAYLPTVGLKESWVLGASARRVWAEIWDDIGPRAESVVQTGVATWDESLLLFLQRSGYLEETYHTFSYSPVPSDDGAIGGMLCVVTEDTERIIGERRLALLRELAADLTETKTEENLFASVAQHLSAQARDIPFGLIYLFDNEAGEARLVCTQGATPGESIAPLRLPLAEATTAWPVTEMQAGVGLVEELATRFTRIPCGPWQQPARQAVLVPIAQQGQAQPAGFLVAGINPYRPFDVDYRGFIDLLAGQVAAALSNVRAYETERKRAEALAELDRAKTTFFSNVSHEFRTPLTLMLGPLNDLLTAANGHLSSPQHELLSLAQRNGQRLLKLVNTLLDFSRLEAGRLQALYEPLDLAAYTADLASVFRAAVEKAGMQLVVDCPPLPEPVYVDRDMWEKIVLNLVSNAFKYTLAGTIRVSVRATNEAAVLTVQDTGIGIPAAALPNIFNRFHRVEGAQGRTHEGTGIGLALVQELTRLHGGNVQVASTIGQGSTFTVTLPLGQTHLPAESVGTARTVSSTAVGATPFVAEALRWLPISDNTFLKAAIDNETALVALPSETATRAKKKIVLADDNADVRVYLQRLLSSTYEIIPVTNGQEALQAIAQELPDLVLSDVMMPCLDGFGLLQALRADARTAELPVIMLSARAGEEARIEGLQAGADDYLIKPFSASELLARVRGILRLATVRQESAEALRKSEERFEKAFNASPFTVTISSLVTGKLLEVNETFVRVTGISRAEAIGRTTAELGVWMNLEDRQDELANVQQAGRVRNAEYRFKTRTGQEVIGILSAETIEIGGELCALTVIADITERKRAEEERERRYRDSLKLIATNRALVGALEISAVTAIICRAARDLTGALGASFVLREGEQVHYVDEDSIAPLWKGQRFPLDCCISGWAIREKQQAIIEDIYEDARIPMDAYAPTFVRSLVMTPVGPGLPIASIGVYWDRKYRATDYELELLQALASAADLALASVRAYDEARRARAQAENANRLKDDFLATISHELRTPLNGILGWAKMLRVGKVSAEKAQAALETIERNARSQNRLIEDLLDVSRIISGKMQLDLRPVSLAAIIEAALNVVRPTAEAKGVGLYSLLATDDAMVVGDAERLQQVIWNLLANAIKFTPRDGSVWIQLEQADTNIEIVVSDTGAGIKPEFLPFVFDRFSQADMAITRQHGGLGLGLAIVRHLIEQHGGTVRVQSAGEGQGATFTVSLPLTTAVPDPSLQPALRVPVPESSLAGFSVRLDGARLLVVDDEPDARELLVSVLTSTGAEVVAVASATDALAQLATTPFDVIISDIAMPNEDGYALIKQVRSRSTAQTLPAIALTAHARMEDRVRALAAGYQTHVPKPVEPAELLTVIRNLIPQPRRS